MLHKKGFKVILLSFLLILSTTLISTKVDATGITATVKIGLCGDGSIDTNEQCDGSALGGKTCTLLGYIGGTLTCSPSCEYNVTACNGASPAQVLIQNMSSVVVPSITANVRITNEGLTSTEYTYEWCVVSSINNACGGGDDTYYASASKLIAAGENFDTTLPATVPLAGTYYFKTNVYFGVLSSSASQQFTASNPASSGGGTNSGGGSGGGGGIVSPPAPSTQNITAKNIEDINGDGKVNGIDFSILLAFWKTSPPYKNSAVDINKDGRVDSVDFSILLYNWGR
ncbi:MAG: dockerin type I domain-containing protein [Candidatus Kaiserbacteria bacterium]|nr:dockerin type I domain-containing protein [Candidatus Kaiserbacteria bacterium]